MKTKFFALMLMLASVVAVQAQSNFLYEHFVGTGG